MDDNAKALLFYLYRNTLVPELFETLGDENAIRFIKVFGGTTLTVPSYKKMSDLENQIEIHKSLSFINTGETVRDLARRYGITRTWVVVLHQKMKTEYPKILKFIEDFKKQITITTKRNPKSKAGYAQN